MSLLGAAGGQSPKDRPPLMASTITLNPYSDPIFLEQLVKAITIRMTVDVSNSAPRVERVVMEDAKVGGHWLRKVERVID